MTDSGKWNKIVGCIMASFMDSATKTELIDFVRGAEQSSSKWIPVTERLPEPGVEVYVCDTYGECFLSWMKNRRGGHSYWVYTECGKITHWIPLPAPPQEE